MTNTINKNYSKIMLPKNIALDIGNVLVHVDLPKFEKFILDTFNYNMYNMGIHVGMDIGLYDIKQCFYSSVTPYLSENDLNMIYEKWLEIVKPSKVMIDLLDILIKDGFNIALLSNIGIDHGKFLIEQCPIFKKCIQHFSYKVGSRKPQKLYYQSFIQETGWDNLCLCPVAFFDDRIENLESAESLTNNWKCVRFDLDDYESDEDAANEMMKHIDDIFS